MDDPKLTIVFKRAPDYRIYAANVFHGGPTPAMDGVLLHFGIDHVAVPSYTTHAVKEGRVDITKPTESISAGQVERELMCGVLLSKQGAYALKAWLENIIGTFSPE